VDLFIIYDDVQYSKHDWRNRNIIKTASGPRWLTVPVDFKLTNKTLIQDTRIKHNMDWVEEHKRMITLAYSGAPYFNVYAKEFFDLLEKRCSTISELNIALIKWVMQKLDIHTEVRLSKEFTLAGERTFRLIDLLRKVGATAYLSGPAAKDYLDERMFRDNGIVLEYKSYDYAPYPQLWGDFNGKVTVFDLISNCGNDSRNYLKSRTANNVV
jgi:hypothetical protein